MSDKISLYKGLYKVKIITESEGYMIIEALENFEDCVEGETITVKTGERRIVPIDTLFDPKNLPPLVKEHTYELKMEKKLKKIIKKEETKNEKANRHKQFNLEK